MTWRDVRCLKRRSRRCLNGKRICGRPRARWMQRPSPSSERAGKRAPRCNSSMRWMPLASAAPQR